MDRISVLGTILNDWDPKRSPSDYYGSKIRRNGRVTPHAFSGAMEVGDGPWDQANEN
jgi:hypothetical protein